MFLEPVCILKMGESELGRARGSGLWTSESNYSVVNERVEERRPQYCKTCSGHVNVLLANSKDFLNFLSFFLKWISWLKLDTNINENRRATLLCLPPTSVDNPVLTMDSPCTFQDCPDDTDVTAATLLSRRPPAHTFVWP